VGIWESDGPFPMPRCRHAFARGVGWIYRMLRVGAVIHVAFAEDDSEETATAHFSAAGEPGLDIPAPGTIHALEAEG